MTAQPAAAHFIVLPGLVTDGELTELSVEVPVTAAATRAVTASGPGLETLSSDRVGQAPTGESQWLLRVRVDAPAGPLPVVVRATDFDGGTSSFRTTLTVVPGSSARGLRWWVVAGLGALVAVAVGLGALRRSRRRA